MSNPIIALGVTEAIIVKLQKRIADAGGEAKVLPNLLSGNDDIFDDFIAGEGFARDLFVRVLDDHDFRRSLLADLEKPEAEFLGNLAAAIDLWRNARPASYEVVRSQILGSPVRNLADAIPQQANDISRVYSMISVDTISESLRVKSALRLIRPDKSLGDDDIFIIASSLASFYYTITLMIGSLLVSDKERQAVTTSMTDEAKSSVYRALELMEQRVRELRAQTEQMLGAKPTVASG